MKTFLFFPEHLEDAKISILGAPYDLNSSRRYGSRFAPDSVRAESRDMESNFMGMELSHLPVEDIGNTETGGWKRFTKSLHEKVNIIKEKGSVPVVIGGDHSITPEIIRSIGRRDIHVVSIDAHLDFDRELFGNTHSHACPRRWEAEMLGAEKIHIIGIRSWPTKSMIDAKEAGVHIIDAKEIMEKGMEYVIKSLPEGDVYLTIDIDGIDPAYAPGTGTPEPFGLMPKDVLAIIERLSKRIVGMDVVEICPPCDVNGITSSLGAHFISAFIASFFSR